jgi:threonine/homoserine/homoserine lactone efflux protein
LGVSQLTKNAWFELVLGGAGGLLMIIFGLNTLIQNRKANKKIKELELKELQNEEENIEENETIIMRNSLLKMKKTRWQYVFDGFLLNAINPFIYIFWVGVVSSVIAKYNYSTFEMIIFLITVILTVLSTDLLKVFFAKKLSRYVNTNTLSIMDKVIGIVLLIFGVHLWVMIWFGAKLVH